MSHWKLEFIQSFPTDGATSQEIRLFHWGAIKCRWFLILSLLSLYPGRSPVICLQESWYGKGLISFSLVLRIYGAGVLTPQFVYFHQIFSKCSQSPHSALPSISHGMREASFLTTYPGEVT